MPTTAYLCRDCGHQFVHLSFKGDPVTPACPQCGGTRIRMRHSDEGFMAATGIGSRITDGPKGPS